MIDTTNTHKSRILDGADLLLVDEKDIEKSISPGFFSDWVDSIRHNHGKHNTLASMIFSFIGFGVLCILWHYVTFATKEVATTAIVICSIIALVSLCSFLLGLFDACAEAVVCGIIGEGIAIPIIYNIAQIPENALPSCGVGNVFGVVGFCVLVVGYLILLVFTCCSIAESKPVYRIRCSSIKYGDLHASSTFDKIGIVLPENMFNRIASIQNSGKYKTINWVNVHYAYYDNGNKIAPDYMVTAQTDDETYCIGFLQHNEPAAIINGAAKPKLSDADKRDILNELKKSAKRRTED